MKNVLISLAIGGAGALFASGANAAPLSVNPSMLLDNGIENVRLVCDDYGRCYRTRGGRRVVIQQYYGDSYNYVPRERPYLTGRALTASQSLYQRGKRTRSRKTSKSRATISSRSAR